MGIKNTPLEWTKCSNERGFLLYEINVGKLYTVSFLYHEAFWKSQNPWYIRLCGFFVSTPTRRGLNNSVYVILLFVSLSVLILRCICIILCQNALVIILLSRLITRIISPWKIWKWYTDIIAYNRSFCNSKF